MENSKRIEIAQKFIAELNKLMGNRGPRITANAKIWNAGDKVRIYGLKLNNYVEVLPDGTLKNQINNPWFEIHEAIKNINAML